MPSLFRFKPATLNIQPDFDYIISGAGAAGMSLLYRMMKQPFFADKKILVVDKASKNINDHTWCFWEQQPGVFEQIVHHQWQDVHFYSNYFSGLFHLKPYSYKMLRSIDLYNEVMNEAARHSNISFVYGDVKSVANEDNKAILQIEGTRYSADFIFNSIIFQQSIIPKGKHYLLQHFKGVVIETAQPIFKTSEATLMDFRVSQQYGTTFVYVLPVAANKALVEYTLFTEKLLQPHEYDEALQDYIRQFIGVKSYQVVEEEFGVIPMTNIRFAKQKGNILNIGTAGGKTKPSSGYTFQFIQKQCDEVVDCLIKSKPFPATTFSEKKFFWYDSVLLNVLANKRMIGDKIFAQLFQKTNRKRCCGFWIMKALCKKTLAL